MVKKRHDDQPISRLQNQETQDWTKESAGSATALEPGDGAKPPIKGATLLLSATPVATLARLSLASESPLPSPGDRIRQYELIRELGRGGMGAVFLARDLQLGRLVAIKFLVCPGNDGLSARFLAEARATARCTHENIVVIHEVSEHRGLLYMVLEYLEGQTLGQFVDQRILFGPTNELGARATGDGGLGYDDGSARAPLAPEMAAELMLPVVRALVRAHELGIVHRDLKPDNIMLTDSGAVKVLDFGIAKLLAGSGAEKAQVDAISAAGEGFMTSTGALVGTLPYMSPEQLAAEEIDHRTDIWAVGIMLYEMVTGRHPLAPLSKPKMLEAADLDIAMPRVTEGSAERAPALDKLGAIIDRCLIKHKEDRTASASELLAELEALVPGPSGLVLTEDESPFSGLAAFQETDAERFFGRSDDIARVIAQLRSRPLLAIVGPSGAGKSSLVRAGVIPTLKRSGEGWEALVIRPGRQPLAGLGNLLARLTLQSSENRHSEGSPEPSLSEQQSLAERLLEQPGIFGAQLRARAGKKLRRMLVFVDQFEELYTLGANADERGAFMRCLEGAADDAASSVRVVLAIRSDFLDRVVEDRAFMVDVSRGLVLLPPMGREALREALTKPVEATGYRFESDEVVEKVLDDLEATPGALPLLQFTASKLWESRDRERRLLTQDRYEAIGGISGTLAGHADAVLSAMAASEIGLASAIFKRLVTPERTRAIATIAELCELPGDTAQVERVIHRLADARLLSVETGRDSGSSSVELIHECLITGWPTLARWLDENQEDAEFLARLRVAAKEWDSGGRREGTLWRGGAARESRRWHGRFRGDLLRREQEYLDAVFALFARTARRKRMLLFAMLGFLTALVIAAAVALVSIRQAEMVASEQRDRAKREARTAASVSEFLVELFASVNPDEAQGKVITVREVLDRGALRIESELSGQPEVRARVLDVMGTVYQNLGQYEEAQRMLGSALEIRESLHEEHVDLAKSLHNLAQLKSEQGDYAAAESLQRRSMTMLEALGKGGTTELAQSKVGLASAYMGQGKLPEAEALLREAVAIFDSLGGTADKKAMGSTMNDLALVLHEKHDLAAAEPVFRKALAIHRETLGKTHTEIATTLYNFGQLLAAQRQFDEAEKMLLEALEMDREIYGDEHANIGYDLSGLARLLLLEGDYAGAETYARQALAMRRRIHGDGHPDVAYSQNDLAKILYARKGATAGVEKLYRDSLATHRKVNGERHPVIAERLHAIGLIRLRLGDLDSAREYHRQGAELTKAIWGEGHVQMALSYRRLAQAHSQRGEHGKAAEMQSKAIAIARDTLGENHSAYLAERKALADIWLEQASSADEASGQGILERAVATYRAALAGQNTPPGFNRIELANIEASLGRALLLSGEHAEAQKFFQSALRARENALAPDHPAVAAALVGLGQAMVALGDAAGAEPLLGRGLAILGERLPPNHRRVEQARAAHEACLAALRRSGQRAPSR